MHMYQLVDEIMETETNVNKRAILFELLFYSELALSGL